MALSGPPWKRRSACPSPSRLVSETRTRPATGCLANPVRQRGVVQAWLTTLLAWGNRDIDRLLADELTVLPGMDEMANLLWINRHRESGQYDLIVVDAAPTGETLRLLSFPDVLKWWMQRIFPIQRRAMGLARPLISSFVDIPLPTEKVYDSVERLFTQLDALHAML